MLDTTEIQDRISLELKYRKERPQMYQGKLEHISNGWLDGLNYLLQHAEDEIKTEIDNVQLVTDPYQYGYWKALTLLHEVKIS